MLEKHLDFPENLNTKVGAYEQTHEEHENDLELITIGGQSGQDFQKKIRGEGALLMLMQLATTYELQVPPATEIIDRLSTKDCNKNGVKWHSFGDEPQLDKNNDKYEIFMTN